ncbi:MAG TPA: tetratricopeptide repeat protein [Pirellulales bacterium]|jgi:tetratricopeptide (TPR) repeat protein|nr:tetratricopeptide repeat protein [Pirellulales bacterium]
MLPPDDSRQRTNRYYAWGVCGFLLLAVGLIYGQTLRHALLEYDDKDFVWANPHITAGLTADGIKWAFTEGPFGEWYPLAPISNMLDCQLFGLEAWGHHLTNLLLHAAASIALFLVLWRMTGELWPSALVAAVFAVHPQHVESVAWVAERRDVLSGLFFMLTLAAWLGYVHHGRSLARYLLVFLLFALGLLSKPMLVTLPPLLLLLDYWPLARFGSAGDTPEWTRSAERPGLLRLMLEKLPLFALAAADCLMTLRTHASGDAPLVWSERIENAAVSCVTYVVQFFYPVHLAVFYPMPRDGHPAWKVAGAIAILTLISAAALIWRRRCPYLFVGWFWYLGMLTPVLGLITVTNHAMADRFMYLSGIGLYIALAWGATRLAGGSLEGLRVLGVCAALVIAVFMAFAAWQTSFWRTDETLWTHALACTADNAGARTGMANALVHQGRFDEAIPHYRRALEIAPDPGAAFDAHLNLGVALSQEGMLDGAIAQFRQALAIAPDSYDAHVDLGGALMRKKRLNESTQHFRRAIEIDPLRIYAHGGLAHVLLRKGSDDEARAEFERAVEIDPRNTAAQNDLGRTLFDLGKIDEAIPHFEAALAIDPNFLRAHLNLAHALAVQGKTDGAMDHYRRALELDPSNAAARQNLNKLLHDNAELLKP